MATLKNTRAAQVRGTKSAATRKALTTVEKEPTPAEIRKMQDQMIKAGAFARPFNLLVHRDPAETIAACKRMVYWLSRVDRTECQLAANDIHALVVDALEHAELSIAGYWAPGGRAEAMRKRIEAQS